MPLGLAPFFAACAALALVAAVRATFTASPVAALGPRSAVGTVFPRISSPSLDGWFWIGSRRAARRRAEIEGELPQLLDLLVAGSSAERERPRRCAVRSVTSCSLGSPRSIWAPGGVRS